MRLARHRWKKKYHPKREVIVTSRTSKGHKLELSSAPLWWNINQFLTRCIKKYVVQHFPWINIVLIYFSVKKYTLRALPIFSPFFNNPVWAGATLLSLAHPYPLSCRVLGLITHTTVISSQHQYGKNAALHMACKGKQSVLTFYVCSCADPCESAWAAKRAAPLTVSESTYKWNFANMKKVQESWYIQDSGTFWDLQNSTFKTLQAMWNAAVFFPAVAVWICVRAPRWEKWWHFAWPVRDLTSEILKIWKKCQNSEDFRILVCLSDFCNCNFKYLYRSCKLFHFFRFPVRCCADLHMWEHLGGKSDGTLHSL
jgi:hypothetical protein